MVLTAGRVLETGYPRHVVVCGIENAEQCARRTKVFERNNSSKTNVTCLVALTAQEGKLFAFSEG